jgi:ketosteroid isomerase-like protein
MTETARRIERARPQRRAALLAFWALLLFPLGGAPSFADDAAADIKGALTQWMKDFNAGKTDKVCDLFAADARANVRRNDERDYNAICDLLVRSLKDETKHYTYALNIKEVLVFGDVAVVRLTWFLTIKLNGQEIKTVEPGMDIFRRQADRSWKIIRYMAYEE